MSDEHRIYVASLADYNNGVLHGKWINADQDPDDIREEVAAMLRWSQFPNVEVECPECEGTDDECPLCGGRGKVPSAEEWAIHDYGGFEGIKLSEYEDFETVSALAEAVEEHGEPFAIYWNCVADGEEVADALTGFSEDYQGEYDSLEDFAEELIEESGDLQNMSENLRYYFDYAAYARDLELGGDIWSERLSNGKLVVFWNS